MYRQNFWTKSILVNSDSGTCTPLRDIHWSALQTFESVPPRACVTVEQHGGASLDREDLPRPTQLCGSARMVGIVSSISPNRKLTFRGRTPRMSVMSLSLRDMRIASSTAGAAVEMRLHHRTAPNSSLFSRLRDTAVFAWSHLSYFTSVKVPGGSGALQIY